MANNLPQNRLPLPNYQQLLPLLHSEKEPNIVSGTDKQPSMGDKVTT